MAEEQKVRQLLFCTTTLYRSTGSTMSFCYKPLCTEIALALDMTEDQLFPDHMYKKRYEGACTAERRALEKQTVSLEDLSEEARKDSGLLAPATQEPEARGGARSFTRFLAQLLQELSPREGEILCYMFGLLGKPELNHEQISRLYPISPSRVQQIAGAIIRKLRSPRFIDKILAHAYGRGSGEFECKREIADWAFREL